MVVFFVIGVQFPGFDNKSIITGAINRTADANPVGPLSVSPSFSWESSVSLFYHEYRDNSMFPSLAIFLENKIWQSIFYNYNQLQQHETLLW
jgi:hypothetical protein